MPQAIILVLLLFVSGCVSAEPSSTEVQFFRLTTDEQISQFRTFGIEKQYELLIAGNQKIHPPALYLVPVMASQGQAGASFLIGKLKDSPSELTIRDIVSVLCEMKRINAYDVSSDRAAMAMVESKVSSMNGPWKLTTVQMLSELERR
jgi:hypothetical protein